MSARILGVIPARGGSKGIPGKNIKPLGGLPLIGHTIKAALESGCLERLWVSTDDPAIARACEPFGVRVPWLRPPELAADDTPTEPVIAHLLERLARDEGYLPDAVMLLQATSPFRTAETIRRAVALFERGGGKRVVSVSAARQHPHWCFKIGSQGFLERFLEEAPPARRQDLTPAYCLDGSIYLFPAEAFLRDRVITASGDLPVVVPEEEAVDLDTPADWRLAEALWAGRSARAAGAAEAAAVFVIAEAGVNHDGDVAKALRLAEAAKEAGADAVKFQTFRAEKLVSRFAAKAPYQEAGTPGSRTQAEMLRRLELDEAAHRRILERCGRVGIQFLSTPFDEESADLLERLGVPLFKLGSGEVTNRPLLEHVAAKGRPIILSTGMSTLSEVAAAVGWIRGASRAPLTLLHCVTEYPAPPGQINLRAMETLRLHFGLPVGYSDHTPGAEVAIAAAALGAAVIEKHLTLDRKSPGPDHASSLEPAEFAAMVKAIRCVALSLGDGVKRPAPCEEPNRRAARRSLVARRALPKGHVLAAGDLAVKRPGHGIPPAMAGSVVGRALARDLGEDETLTWEALA